MPKSYIKKDVDSNKVILKTIDDITNKVYKPKKVDSFRIIDLYRTNFNDSEWLDNKIDNMLNCSNYLVLNTPSLNGELILNKTKVTKASFCRDRFCPMCSYRLSRKNHMNLAKVMKVLVDCKRQFLFLTLTIPNVKASELNETLVDLQKAWKRFYNNRIIKARFNGFYRTLEITYNSDSDSYHAHLHAIVCVSSSYFKGENYLSQERIKEIWTRCNSKLFQSYLLDHPDTNINGFLTYVKKVNDLQSACYELSKYCCKSTDLNERSFKPLFDAFYNSKCYSYVGEFKVVFNALKLNEKLEDDYNELIPDYEWIITHWNYDSKIKSYILKQIPN